MEGEAGGTQDPLWEHCMWQNIFPHYSWGLIMVFTHSIHTNTYFTEAHHK